ncbi:MAG: ABC transporter permease [Deltaproteobacteria bacterium]|nr:ABC transporter permease [Deltaproteobacteria bacterium]
MKKRASEIAARGATGLGPAPFAPRPAPERAEKGAPASVPPRYPLEPAPRALARAREFWGRFRVHYFSLFGLVALAFIGLAVSLGPVLYGIDPFEIVSAPFMEPGGGNPLGTDYVGRDVLAGVLSGGRASLSVGFFAALFTGAIGLSVGSLAGFFGGALDAFLMKVTEFFQVLPTLLFAMVLVTIFGPTLWMETLAIGLASWMSVARLARAEFIKIKELDYVKSAVSAGAAPRRLIFKTILPNALPPILVAAAFDVSFAILLEGSLSFLGLGDPNQMSWGLIIGQNKNYALDAWWTIFFPGFAIFLSVLAVCLVSDGLNHALNPRARKSFS